MAQPFPATAPGQEHKGRWERPPKPEKPPGSSDQSSVPCLRWVRGASCAQKAQAWAPPLLPPPGDKLPVGQFRGRRPCLSPLPGTALNPAPPDHPGRATPQRRPRSKRDLIGPCHWCWTQSPMTSATQSCPALPAHHAPALPVQPRSHLPRLRTSFKGQGPESPRTPRAPLLV